MGAMKPLDPALASPFRIEWLVETDALLQDDYGRAIAEKAEAILRAARFLQEQRGATPTDMEIRVWVEAAMAPGCVSITWEPGFQAFGFHLLDETLKERVAVIVFRDLPCVDADASDGQIADILATLAAMAASPSANTVRVPVVERRPVDPGVER